MTSDAADAMLEVAEDESQSAFKGEFQRGLKELQKMHRLRKQSHLIISHR